MDRRQTVVKSVLAALLILPFLTSCFSDQAPRTAPESRGQGALGGPTAPRGTVPPESGTQGPGQGTSLSDSEVAEAVAVAQQEIADQGATISNASAIARSGRIENSNTGHPCTSGRLLQIKLIGKFPHVVTTGHPVKAGDPVPDFTVRAMIITADAETGHACLISVQTAENGGERPIPGATILHVK